MLSYFQNVMNAFTVFMNFNCVNVSSLVRLRKPTHLKCFGLKTGPFAVVS